MKQLSDIDICKKAKCPYLNKKFGICRLQRLLGGGGWKKMSKATLNDLEIPENCPFYLEQLVNDKKHGTKS